jgi:hypothetical protein
MDDYETLTETERLLLMAAAVHRLGPYADMSRANTVRVVNQVLRWRGLSEEEIESGWWKRKYDPIHEAVYDILIRMVHQRRREGPGQVAERGGAALFEGNGNWGVPGDPSCPACMPHFNSCRLTAEGKRVARELLKQNPQCRKRAE